MLTDKICVVTGGTEGIGFAIAEALGRAGAKVAICSRSETKVKRAVSLLRDVDVHVVGTTCDVSSPEDVSSFRDLVNEQLGQADILVNNAGLGYFASLEETTLEQFRQTMDVNVLGVFLVTQVFLPDLQRDPGGDIVNVVSLAGKNGFVRGSAYAASKHAVLGLSKCLMLELRQQGIRVTAICPGSVDTAFFDRAGEELDNADRVLRPEEIGELVKATLLMPRRAMVSELDIRPSNP